MNDSTLSELSLTSVVAARSDLLSTALSESEVVLLDIDSGQYFGMEAVANTIWRAVAEPQAIVEVCDVISATYDAPRGEVESDTLAFISSLVNAGLVQVDAGTG